MSGCDWQNKSFSVAVSDSFDIGKCSCGKPFPEIKYQYNGERVCRECFLSKPSIKNKEDFGYFNTSRDKLWDFIDDKNFGKTVHITSKRQWKEELRKHGLHDDCDNRPHRPEEVIGKNVPKYEPISRREISDYIHQELKSKWLNGKIIKRR